MNRVHDKMQILKWVQNGAYLNYEKSFCGNKGECKQSEGASLRVIQIKRTAQEPTFKKEKAPCKEISKSLRAAGDAFC